MSATITPVQAFSSSLSPILAPSMLRSLTLPGPAGRLEALLNEGEPDAPFAALVCHPHPLGGGSMHNKVVYHAMKAMNDQAWGLGWPVLRFNFRGTGLSQGAHHGDAETNDVLAALEWLENEYRRPVIVVGFSFGAVMALRACCGQACCSQAGRDRPQVDDRISSDDRFPSRANPNVRALVALGLPTRVDGRTYDFSFLAHCNLPKLFLSGDQDQFAPSAQWAQVAGSAAEPKRLVLLPGADHFFTGQLNPMQSALSGWLKEQLP